MQMKKKLQKSRNIYKCTCCDMFIQKGDLYYKYVTYGNITCKLCGETDKQVKHCHPKKFVDTPQGRKCVWLNDEGEAIPTPTYPIPENYINSNLT